MTLVSSLKDFRNIADEIMSGINVGDELKRKTLMRLREKRRVHINKALIPAACLGVLLTAIGISGILPLHRGDTGVNPMAESGGVQTPFLTEDTPTGGEKNNPGSDAEVGWRVESLDEAKNSFGDFFLTPAYVPEGFTQSGINASGTLEDPALRVEMSYASGERSFVIIEDKNSPLIDFTGFETVDINGYDGYLKAARPDNYKAAAAHDTELHWHANGVRYAVAGQISGEEALRIANSME